VRRRLGGTDAADVIDGTSEATMGLTGLFYNWGFFTLLAYSPFLMDLNAIRLGLVFCG
jgi:hypothetical protein